MTTRRADTTPTFQLLQNHEERLSVAREIAKVKPEIEVTLEGLSEVAKGRIVEWHPTRHFFIVEWSKKTTAFSNKVESQSELRAFFKAQLFSAQLVFKTMTVRRVKAEVYHFRIPEQIYRKQQRGALRVPIISKNATLSCAQGEFEIVDLSVSGAKLKRTSASSKIRLGMTLTECELKLGRKKITTPDFEAKITSENDVTMGCRFSGLINADKVTIKQFLVEALRVYYKEEL